MRSASARRCGAWTRARRARRTWRSTARGASSTRSPTTSTRRRRSRRCTSGCARPTAAAAASATRDLREMLAVLGLDERCCAPAREAPRRRGRRARCEQREQARAAARLRARRRAARARSRALGWEVRDVPRRLRAAPARDVILYGRNPVREALRGARGAASATSGRRAGAAREPWLAGVEPRIAAAEEIERRCGSSCAPGRLRRGRRLPLRRRRRAARRRAAADRRARPGPGPAEPRLDLPHGRVRRRGRRGDPRAARRRGHAGGLQGLGGRRRAPARRARAQPRRLPRRGAPRRLLVLRRQRRATSAPVAYDAPDYAGAGVVLVLGSEGSGLRPRVAKALRRADRAAAARAHRVARRQRRRRGAPVRDLAAARERP